MISSGGGGVGIMTGFGGSGHELLEQGCHDLGYELPEQGRHDPGHELLRQGYHDLATSCQNGAATTSATVSEIHR